MNSYEQLPARPASVTQRRGDTLADWTPPHDGGTPPHDGGAPQGETGGDTVAMASRRARHQQDRLARSTTPSRSARYGHLAAQLAPLATPSPGDPSLDPAAHGIIRTTICAPCRQLNRRGRWSAARGERAGSDREALKRVYAATTGTTFDHIRLPSEREWLRNAAESASSRRRREIALDLLRQLTEVEVFERFSPPHFPRQAPLLDLRLDNPRADAGQNRRKRWRNRASIISCLGMAHRGRLNVLAHILDKPYRAAPGRVSKTRSSRASSARPRLDGRRQISLGGSRERLARTKTALSSGGAPCTQPEPSRSGQPGGRRHGARRRNRREPARTPTFNPN